MSEKLEKSAEKIAEVVVTPSVYLACFLGTMGCTPQQILKGPERTQLGHPITKWVYENKGLAEELYIRWGKPDEVFPEYKDWSEREKQLVASYVSAFAENLRHFLTEVKKDGVK